MTEQTQNGNQANAYTPLVLCFAATLLVCALFSPTPGFVSVVIVALCITAAILYLKDYSILAVGAVLTFVLAGASIGIAAYAASQAGTTLQADFRAAGAQVQQIFLQTYGSAATPEIQETLKQTVGLVARLWPFTYFVSAVITVSFSFGLCSFIAKRFGIDLGIIPLSQVDFSPHVLWIPVAGLLVLAASFVLEGQRDLLVTIAVNLAAITKVVLIIQATGVYAGFVSRIKGWGFVKVFGYLCCLWFEMFLWLMSIVGLLDFWRNFRRLPRESTPVDNVDEAAV